MAYFNRIKLAEDADVEVASHEVRKKATATVEVHQRLHLADIDLLGSKDEDLFKNKKEEW